MRFYYLFDAPAFEYCLRSKYSGVSSALLCSASSADLRPVIYSDKHGKYSQSNHHSTPRSNTPYPFSESPVYCRYPALPSAARIRMLQRRLKSIKQLASAPTEGAGGAEGAGGGGGGGGIVRDDVSDNPSPAAALDATI